MNRISQGTVIGSFKELEDGLRDWKSFKDPEVYDVGGMWSLFCACTDNLQKYALPAEIEDLAKHLSDEQCAFLKLLVDFRWSYPARANGSIACRRAVCWGLWVGGGGCEVVGGGGVFFGGIGYGWRIDVNRWQNPIQLERALAVLATAAGEPAEPRGYSEEQICARELALPFPHCKPSAHFTDGLLLNDGAPQRDVPVNRGFWI